MLKGKKGFTLIELLVVIGILGILAIGLLAAIDPFEQLKKGRDTNMRNVAVEYVNACTRYYATHGEMPWCDPSTHVCDTFPGGGYALNSANAITYTTRLIGDGELKSTFQSGLGTSAQNLYLSGAAAPTNIARVCFNPDSKAISRDQSTQYTNSDGTGTCDPQTSLACYWCAQ